MLPYTISNRISELMTYHKLNTTDFAKLLNVHKSTISHILSGRNTPSLEIVSKILKAFNRATYDWLVLNKGYYPNKSFNHQTWFKNLQVELKEEKKINKILVFFEDGTFKQVES